MQLVLADARQCSNGTTHKEETPRCSFREVIIHDGVGIRTIVFLKGCALRCRWCCNPESQEFEIQTMMVNGRPKTIGKDVTVKEVMRTVERDMPYYGRSGGGLTLSGG